MGSLMRIQHKHAHCSGLRSGSGLVLLSERERRDGKRTAWGEFALLPMLSSPFHEEKAGATS